MTVYVLIEDDTILGVFSTRQLAEEHAKAISNGLDISEWSMGRIGEFTVDAKVKR